MFVFSRFRQQWAKRHPKAESFLRIFQRNGPKSDKDLIFSGLAQNVHVYPMAKSKKI